MNAVQNGKGSRNRSVGKKYRDGYAKIRWSRPMPSPEYPNLTLEDMKKLGL